MDDFEIHETVRFSLLRNGEPVVDEHGQPKLYGSREEAEFVAASWDLQRAPSFAELVEMSDDELRFRGGL